MKFTKSSFLTVFAVFSFLTIQVVQAQNDATKTTEPDSKNTPKTEPTGNAVLGQKGANTAVTIGKIKFPYTFKYEGNPLSRIHGAADPDAQVYDGEVWGILLARQINGFKQTQSALRCDGWLSCLFIKRYDKLDGSWRNFTFE
jgi:hypothetical protein